MARDTETVETVATPATDETNSTTPTTEAQAPATQPDAGATDAPAPAAPVGPTAEEINTALDSFEELVDGILGTPPSVEPKVEGKIDNSNGEVPADEMTKIVEAYRNLPGGTRAHTKATDRLTKNQMLLLTEHMWAVGARALALILGELRTAGKGTRARAEGVAKPTVSPTEAHVALAAAHALSVNFLTVGEGVDENWGAMVNEKVSTLASEVGTYRAYLDEKAKYDALSDEDKANATEPTAPEVDMIIVQAARLARGRVAGPKKATAAPKSGAATPRTPRDPNSPRGSILDHIKEVFAGHPVGTFLKVSEIAKATSEQYPAGNASGGAVSSRIEKESFRGAIPGLEYTESPVKGVTKVA